MVTDIITPRGKKWRFAKKDNNKTNWDQSSKKDDIGINISHLCCELEWLKYLVLHIIFSVVSYRIYFYHFLSRKILIVHYKYNQIQQS